MTTAEFREWFAYHRSRFTGINGWLEKYPVEARSEGDVTRASIRDAWESVVRRASLVDAKDATDALFRGDEQAPRSFDEHPQTIMRLTYRAKHNAPRKALRYIDDQEVFQCGLCCDRGYVPVYSAKTLIAIRDGRTTITPGRKGGYGFSGPFYVTTAPCKCDAGSRDWCAPKEKRYSESAHCIVTKIGVEDQFNEINEWLNGPKEDVFDPYAWGQT